MKDWLKKTHGTLFELLRHFLSTFFDNDLITVPGQMTPALIGAFSLFLPWFQILIAPLHDKYTYLSSLSDPKPYREAVRADELWLITLMMSAIGLLTAVKWQSVFPDARDYRSLASLPLRRYQIFLARLSALLLIATAVIPTLNVVPGLLFPILSDGHWSITSSLGQRVVAHWMACISGSYFFVFGLVGLQGMLLLLLPERLFSAVKGYLQGILVSAMLALIVGSFSIQPTLTGIVLDTHWARWLPPVWFLAVYQNKLGDSDPQMWAMAHWALAGLLGSMFLTLITYFLAYRRSAALEDVAQAKPRIRRQSGLLELLSSKPRQAGVCAFIGKTLASSSHHRMILMGYLGLGGAILVTGVVGIWSMVQPGRLIAADFIYAHLLMVIFMLIGFRHLFSIPVELQANWIFRITEPEGRKEWLGAVDRFVLGLGATGLFLAPFPVELKLLGWRAVGESTLLAVFGLVCFQCVFYSWEKLPFTCSHLPGKFPVWLRALQLFGLIMLLAPARSFLLVCLYNPVLFSAVLIVLLVAATLMNRNRMRARGEIRLKYEESLEPAVLSLSLLK